MNEQQERICTALQERRPELAEMYGAALELLHNPPAFLSVRTRISYICHSMREVMNRVLEAMRIPTAPRLTPPTVKQVQQLPDLLASFPDLKLDSDSALVQIPNGVAKAIDQLFKSAVQEKRRSREDVASLLTDDHNTQHAAVVKWIESRDFFVKWTHIHSSQDKHAELPTDSDMTAHIKVFEDLYDGVITAFFTLRHSIDDLLADINATGENDHA